MEQNDQDLVLTFPLTQTTTSPEETEALGAALAHAWEVDSTLPPFIAMYGDLGVGKTAFVRGLASILAPGRMVKSPTFALVHEHRVPGKHPLFHFDLYRIDSEDDLFSIGYDDYLDAGYCVAEWCEKIPYALPARRIEVCIRKGVDDPHFSENPNIRYIEITVVSKEVPSC